MGKIRLVLVVIIIVTANTLPAPAAQSKIVGVELSATDLEIAPGWGNNEGTGALLTNVGDRLRVGRATIGAGFEISDDGCALTLNTGESCFVSVVRSFDGPPGLRDTRLRFWSANGDPLGQVNIAAASYDGLFAVARTGKNSDRFPDVALSSRNSGATIESDGVGISMVIRTWGQGGSHWTLRMSPPEGQRFEAGDRYRDVGSEPTTPFASLFFIGDGRGCVQSNSSIDIDRATYEGDELVSLRATFAVDCGLPPSPDVGLVAFDRSVSSAEIWAGSDNYEIGAMSGFGAGTPVILANLSGAPSARINRVRAANPDLEVLDDQCLGEVLEAFGSCTLRVRPSSLLPGSFTSGVEIDAGGSRIEASFAGRVERFDIAYKSTVVENGDLNISDDQIARSSTTSEFTGGWTDSTNRFWIALGDTRLALQPAAGDVLEVGAYTNVKYGGAEGPLLSFNSDKFKGACTGPGSSFSIHEIERQPAGGIAKLSASFSIRGCGLDIDGSMALNLSLTSSAVATSVDKMFFAADAANFQTVRLTNIGSLATPLSIDIVDDSHNAFYIVDGNCPRVLEPEQTCTQTIEVALFGTGQGNPSAALVVRGDGDHASPTIALATPRNRDWPVGPSAPSSFDAGYWLLEANGDVSAFGDARNLGGAPPLFDAVEMIPTPSGRGYWILDEFGLVWTFGDAPFLGELTLADVTQLEPGEVLVSMSATSTSQGYWVFTSRGRVFTFGDAPDIGDLTAIQLSSPIVDSATSPSGRGVYMLGADGGVFSLGDAEFAGSVPQVLPGVVLDEPIVGISADPDGSGYWLVAADGGIFAFDAPFRGSVPAVLPPGAALVAPVNGMVPYGNGYLLVAADGGVFSFSNLAFSGSLGGGEISGVVAVAPIIVGGGRYHR